MVGVKITCDTSKILNVIGKMAEGDFTVPLERIGKKVLYRRTMECFKKQQTPDGEPWKPLHPITKALRRRGKKDGEPLILQDSGTLRNRVTTQVTMNIDKTSLEYGTNLEYAEKHQYGGEAEMTVIRKKNVKNKSGKYGKRKAGWQEEYTVKSGKNKGQVIMRYATIGTAYTKTIQVPARPFLGVNNDDKEDMIKILSDWYKEIFNGA